MNERLQKLKADVEAAQARLRQEMAREQQRERDREARRKTLAGDLVLQQCAQDENFASLFRKRLDHFLTKPGDRELFGLPPLPDPPNGMPPVNGSGNGTGH